MALKKFKIAACLALASATLLFCLLPSACTTGGKKIRISVGLWQGASAEEKEFYEECASAFEKKYPQYEITSSPYVYSVDTIVAKFASGQLPTVFEIDSSLAQSALGDGYIKDVAAYMEECGWLDKADGYFLTQISVDGAVCGIPAEQYASGMVLNLPLLREAGVIDCDAEGNYVLYGDDGAVYPDTFEEIETAARKVVQNCPDGTYGVFLPSGDVESGKIYTDIIYNFGIEALEYADSDGKWKLSLGNEEVGDAMRWVKKMAQEGYADVSAAYGVDEWTSRMAENRVAFAFCQSNTFAAALEIEPSLNGNIAFVPMPVAGDAQSRSTWNGKIYAVSGRASEEQTEGAFRFLEYMGYGPDTDEQTLRFAERRVRQAYEKNISVLPVISVWQDEEYLEKMQDIYERYKNGNEAYFAAFYSGFNARKRTGEPYARDNLHAVIDGLFGKMLFEPTTSNLVTLLAESEAEFTAKYLSKTV